MTDDIQNVVDLADATLVGEVSNFDPALALQMLGVALFAGLAILLVVWFVYGFITYKLAKKANHEKAWYAFIPVLSSLVRHDIAFGKKRRPWFIAYFAFSSALASTLFAQSFSEGFTAGSMMTNLEQTVNTANTPVSVGVFGGLIGAALLIELIEKYFRYKFLRSFGKSHLLVIATLVFPIDFFVDIWMAFGSSTKYIEPQRHEIAEKFE